MSDAWTTRDGRNVNVSDMTDSHLINTIRMLRKNAPSLAYRLLRDMDRYAASAPDGAADCVAMESDLLFDRLLEMYRSVDARDKYLSNSIPQWGDLLREAERRGLNP